VQAQVRMPLRPWLAPINPPLLPERSDHRRA
jgi:hypothetical protein